jgi:hypothetical protein
MNMKILLLIAQLLLPAVTWAQVNANAGPDKISAPGKPVIIGTPGDGRSCYFWESTPEDQGITNRHVPQIKVNPNVPTVYKLTVTAADFSSQSSDNVTVSVFTINYLRYNSNYTWKVVQGLPMEYSANTTMEGTSNWNWELGDWQTTGGNAANGIMEWGAAPLPQSNNAFGETNGAVTVSCNGPDGTLYTASTLNNWPIINAEVFYQRDGVNNPSGLFPNWFYYWANMLDVSNLNVTQFSYYNTLPRGEYAHTDLGERLVNFSKKAAGLNRITNHTGLHCFIEVLAHENQHMVIYDTFWPDGYDESRDVDSDYHPDSWEAFYGGIYGFVVGVDDDENFAVGSPAYKYQEPICTQAERDAAYDAYDSMDWSFDPTGQYQGKQWISRPSVNSIKK